MNNPDKPQRASEPSISVTLDVDTADAPDTKLLRDRLTAVVDQLRLREVELSVVIVGDAAMAALHEQYSGVGGPTDVLTFDLRDEPFDATPGEPANVEGEIYVCLDEARRRAAERDHDVERELLLYTVHGLLHLLGYDDQDPEDHARMHAREDELLAAIGVGRVYGGEESGRM